ncbi:uncharacterized protein LOC131314567 isoform X1 [Rhododendron vialii]|uniref:uncharacterized protein LOC131314567 isoform X1 n=1 Tax=Rhododendron vialii TaxID=182163 RepID=UPI00265E5AF2|nr:uncharacterized protein LOC131314567 isoform X1 [Rhododendron vialii]
MLKQSLSLDQRTDAVKECRISLSMLPPRTEFRGWFFLIFGCVSFLGFFYAAIISKFLPPSDNALISAVQNDRYYCFLVPLTLPILVVAVYFHWLSMKFFKHA